jgi:hypothetical protein
MKSLETGSQSAVSKLPGSGEKTQRNESYHKVNGVLSTRFGYRSSTHRTSVPPPGRLFRATEAPIIAARSRMPVSP